MLKFGPEHMEFVFFLFFLRINQYIIVGAYPYVSLQVHASKPVLIITTKPTALIAISRYRSTTEIEPWRISRPRQPSTFASDWTPCGARFRRDGRALDATLTCRSCRPPSATTAPPPQWQLHLVGDGLLVSFAQAPFAVSVIAPWFGGNFRQGGPTMT